MSLSGQQRQTLQEALINAFPSKSSLEQMLSFQLNKSLDTFAGGDNLQVIVFNIIKIAEAEDWVENLIEAARKSNPGNKLLKDIATKLLSEIISEKPAVSPRSQLLTQPTQPKKILILAAIPHGLRLDREMREIEESIRRAVQRDLFEICIRTAVRHQDIRRAIAEEQPQIVHFCGHGMEDGSLLLEDEGGKNKPVLPEALASLFELHAEYVKCVLLNACYSEKPAVAISKYIDYVIGMNNPIEDRAAIAFARGFYDGLGYKISGNQDTIQRAFKEAMVATKFENLSQGQIPVLKKKIKLTRKGTAAKKTLLLGITVLSLSLIFLFKLRPQPISSNRNPDSEIRIDNPQARQRIPVTGDEASEVGADYTKLRDLLENQEFAEADVETTRKILWVARQEEKGGLELGDLLELPSKDLQTINQLWLAASKGKFGFSVQKQILTDLGSETNRSKIFLKKVGWANNEIIFDQRAVKGHLPVGVYVKASNDLRIERKWWVGIDKIIKTSEEELEKERKRGENHKMRVVILYVIGTTMIVIWSLIVSLRLRTSHKKIACVMILIYGLLSCWVIRSVLKKELRRVSLSWEGSHFDEGSNFRVKQESNYEMFLRTRQDL